MKSKYLLKRIGSDNSGATAIEYGLIVSLIVIACMAAFQAVAGESIDMWTMVSSKVTAAKG